MLHFSKTIVLATVIASSAIINAQEKAVKDQTHFKMPTGLTSADLLEKTIIIKVKGAHRNICSYDKISHSKFNQLFSAIGGTGLKKKFPKEQAPERKFNDQGQAYADISLIYEFSYSAD